MDEDNTMGEISIAGRGSKETTGKAMSNMGYSPLVKPKSMKTSMRMGIKKPKMRNFSRSK